jgi:hypothetical protein
MAGFYHDDAVNHQMPHEPAEGRAAIREMFTRDFVEAEMECIVENIFEDGDRRCAKPSELPSAPFPP